MRIVLLISFGMAFGVSVLGQAPPQTTPPVTPAPAAPRPAPRRPVAPSPAVTARTGLAITVTDRRVTRYFMTIPEAVQLVLHAAALPEAAGRICMLDMGEPVRIVDLAENLIRLSGLEPYRDVPIVFTGLRPGEKLHEELMSANESTVATQVPKVRIVETFEPRPDSLASSLDHLAALTAVGSHRDVLSALCELVPECVPPLRDRQLMTIEGD